MKIAKRHTGAHWLLVLLVHAHRGIGPHRAPAGGHLLLAGQRRAVASGGRHRLQLAPTTTAAGHKLVHLDGPVALDVHVGREIWRAH